MPKRGTFECLSDIQESISRIEFYIGDKSYAEFLKDSLIQDAIVRNLEIIGEAAKNIPPDYIKKHTEIEWGKIAGFRDKLIHNYFGVNWDIMWDVLTSRLPKLKNQVQKLLQEITKG